MQNDQKEHWEHIYDTKNPEDVSWTQKVPKVSLEFLNSFEISKTTSIIDVGGGDSLFVDYLIQLGYQNITVLDISGKAIEKTKKRLGAKAQNVHWIESDILDFKPEKKYEIWHDRAAFHFLITPEQVSKYLEIIQESVNGFVILGTFSKNGPKKCSGLEIKQYDERELSQIMKNGFEKINCLMEDHITPFGTAQNFLFCSFKKINL